MFDLIGFEGSQAYEKIREIFDKVRKQLPPEDSGVLERKNTIVVLGDKVNSYAMRVYVFQQNISRIGCSGCRLVAESRK